MIQRDELEQIGAFLKPHGIKGEIAMEMFEDVELSELSCIVLDMDGIFVPFFIESVRPKGPGRMLVTIDGVNSDTEAAAMAGAEVYALRNELPETEDSEDGFYLSDLTGYTVIDASNGVQIGTVTDYDDSTDNVVLILQSAADSSETIYRQPNHFSRI